MGHLSPLEDLFFPLQQNSVEHSFHFLVDGTIRESCTPQQMHTQACAVAALLHHKARPGDRILLSFEPGLSFIPAFVGCLYAGMVAVPVTPPRSHRQRPRLLRIVEDAGVSLALTDSDLASWLSIPASPLPSPTDESRDWQLPDSQADTLAFLQYTSGSTGHPKGVMVSLGNLLANLRHLQPRSLESKAGAVVSWLPVYHDMGLIYGILHPLYCGRTCYLMAPAAFMQQPLRWLQAISDYKATHSTAPNFAYDLCTRTLASKALNLDLSHWTEAGNGAEPVSSGVIRQFTEAFRPYGFRETSFRPAYGLAEATLKVCATEASERPAIGTFCAASLGQGQVALGGDESVELVGLGWSEGLALVNPHTMESLEDGVVGEVWLRSDSVAQGYWQKPVESTATFGGTKASGEGPFLRTGDLGFRFEGQLYITGRLRDMLIFRGRNYYPQDLETTASLAHHGFQANGTAAFSITTAWGPALVLVMEATRQQVREIRKNGGDHLAQAVRDALAQTHDLALHQLVLLKPGGLPRTTSGKVRRQPCRQAYLNQSLATLWTTFVEREDGALSARNLLAQIPGLPHNPDEQLPLSRQGLDSLGATLLYHRLGEVLGQDVTLDLHEITLARIEDWLQNPPPKLAVAPLQHERQALSDSQQNLWHSVQLARKDSVYHIPIFAHLSPPPDPGKLETSLHQLWHEHPSLSTAFPSSDGVPFQQQGCGPPDLLVLDVSSPAKAGEAGLLQAFVEKPFPLTTGPLLRVALVRGQNGVRLCLCIHHLLVDMWALEELVTAWMALYHGAGLPHPPPSSAELALLQRGGESEHVSWWRRYLADAPTDMELPVDGSPPPVFAHKGDTYGWEQKFDPAWHEALRRWGITPFVGLLGIFLLVRSRLSGRLDLMTGYPDENRKQSALAHYVGCQVETRVLRFRVDEALSFRQFLQGLQRQVEEVHNHEISLWRLTHELGRAPQPGLPNGLIPIMFAYNRSHLGEAFDAFASGQANPALNLWGTQWKPQPFPCTTAQFPLTLTFSPLGDHYQASLEYSADHFQPHSVTRMATCFDGLLNQAFALPSIPLRHLMMHPPSMEAVLLGAPSPTPVHLLTQLDTIPPEARVVDGAVQGSYGDMLAQARGIAAQLHLRGTRPAEVVALHTDDEATRLAGILGIWMAGGTLLPLDHEAPAKRQATLLTDAGVRYAVTDKPEALSHLATSLLGTHHTAAAFSYTTPAPEVPAYILYTSGSSGRPKGVSVSHGALSHHVVAVVGEYALDASDRVARFAGPAFDVALEEILPTLWSGATLVVHPEGNRASVQGFVTWSETNRVTVLNLPASFFSTWMGLLPQIPQSLRLMIVGSEPLPAEALRRWQEQADVPLINAYGPTEATITATTFRPTGQSSSATVPVGGPLPGTGAQVRDRWGRVQPLGAVGELWLWGERLAQYYHQRPRETAMGFVPLDVPGQEGARAYRTGDRVRIMPEPQPHLVFLGRLDAQLKIRGHRIEPGEVEGIVSALPGVVEVAVTPNHQGDGLLIFVVGDARDVLATLQQNLPAPLLPRVVSLAALPKTSGGKLDRAALARYQPADAPRPGRRHAPDELVLAQLWSMLLQIPLPDPDDNFFHLGGHSLLVMRLIAALQKHFGKALDPRQIFENPILSQQAKLLGNPSALAETGPQPRLDREQAPLSSAQRRLWFLSKLGGAQRAYQMPGRLHLEGPLDVSRLERTLADLLHAHDVFKVQVEEGMGEPKLVFAPFTFVLVVVDSPDSCKVEADLKSPFSLEQAPLWRMVLLRQGSHRHTLLINVHHFIWDGASVNLFLDELAQRYEAADQPPKAPEIDYGDFASWEQVQQQKPLVQASLSFWQQYLADTETHLNLPRDRAEPATPDYTGASLLFSMSQEVVCQLHQLARDQGTTPFLICQAVLALVLARFSMQDDILVGLPQANREYAQVQKTVGLFAQTLVVRHTFDYNHSWHDVLRASAHSFLKAYAHRHVPFEWVVQAVQKDAGLHQPLFQVMLSWQEPMARRHRMGLNWQAEEMDTGTSPFQQSWSLELSNDLLQGSLTYAIRVFDKPTCQQMVHYFQHLLSVCVRAENVPLHQLCEPPEDRASILLGLTQGNLCSTSLMSMWLRQVNDSPHALALLEEDGAQHTYLAIHTLAGALAAQLDQRGIGIETPVGIALDWGMDRVVAQLAVLWVGACHVPLPAGKPSQRAYGMARDAGAACVITQQEASWPDVDCFAPLGYPPVEPKVADNLPQSGMYIRYTSGSSGKPKGVVGTHQGCLNRLAWMWQQWPFEDGEVACLKTEPGFVDAVWELYGPLLAGVPMLALSQGLVREMDAFIQRLQTHRVTRLLLVPSHLQAMLQHDAELGSKLAHVKVWTVSGEPLSPALNRHFHETFPEATLLNLYGSTEVSGDVTATTLAHGQSAVSVGHPLPNNGIWLMDHQLHPVPQGARGLIFVEGMHMARGYHREARQTALYFVPHPLGSGGQRLYRTGDLGRVDASGQLMPLGRSDRQFKIRGRRIEPGEIERVMLDFPEANAAAVIFEQERLLGFVAGLSSLEALRSFLNQHLPPFMVPQSLIPIPKMPYTASGKLDRRALVRMVQPEGAGKQAIGNTAQDILAAIWCNLLNLDSVGADDHFFELGGHSLSAVRLAAHVEEVFGKKLSVASIFAHPRLAQLAQHLETIRDPSPARHTRLEDGEPIPLSVSQRRIWQASLWTDDPKRWHLSFCVHFHGLLDLLALQGALTDVVQRHEPLHTVFHGNVDQPEIRLHPTRQQALPIFDIASPRMLMPLMQTWETAPFDLAREFPFRTALVRHHSQYHLLLVVWHHIAGDGWSMDILRREVRQAYAARVKGRASQLPPLAIRHRDVAHGQIQDETQKATHDFWRKQLEGATSAGLPFDEGCEHGDEVCEALLEQVWVNQLQQLAHLRQSSLFTILLAAFKVLLVRHGAPQDLTIGTPMAHRRGNGEEALIGCFLQMLPLRSHLDATLPFTRLLRNVRTTLLNASAHASFTQLHEEGRNTFQCLFNLVNTPMGEITLPGLRSRWETLSEAGARYPLDVSLHPSERGMQVRFRFQRSSYARHRIQALLDQYLYLLQQCVAHPEQPLHSFSLVLPQHRAFIVDHLDPPLASPQVPIPELFASMAEKFPEYPAIITPDTSITYDHLFQNALVVAQHLRERGLQPRRVVAVQGGHSVGTITAALGVMYACGVLLLLDQDLPEDYCQRILQQANPQLLIHTTPSPLAFQGTTLCVPDTGEMANTGEGKLEPGLLSGEDPAYLFFSSGSTGTPKGSLGFHASLTHFLEWERQHVDVRAQDRVAHITGLSFDPVLREIFLPLSSGATLCMPPQKQGPDDVLNWLVDANITLLHTTPSLLSAWMDAAPDTKLPRMRHTLLAGEPLPSPLVTAWRERLAAASRITNLYGTTEACLAQCFYEVGDPPQRATVSVGRALGEIEVCVRNAWDQSCGVYEQGRILMYTPYAAKVKGETPWLVETGDLGYLDETGLLHLTGREDDQLKIRGVRVHPNEVRNALVDLAAVSAATVIATGEPLQLVGFVVTHASLDAASIRAQLAQKLTAAKVPGRIILVEKLPLTPNGKVDRQALASWADRICEQNETKTHIELPPMDTLLMQLYAQVLSREVGPDDDFFLTGGHSLAAMRFAARVEEILGHKLHPRFLFHHPTPRKLASWLLEQQGHQLAPLQTTNEPSVSVYQERLWLQHQMEPKSSSYHIPVTLALRGQIDVLALEKALAAIVEKHHVLRASFPAHQGKPALVVNPVPAHLLKVIDVAPHQTLREAEARRPFAVETGPLVRFTLVRSGPTTGELWITAHHMVADGWSLNIFLQALQQAYDGQPLKAPQLQYSDFATWHRSWLDTPEAQKARTYWRKVLNSLKTTPLVPPDRSSGQTETVALIHRSSPANLQQGLNEAVRKQQVTPFMMLLATLAMTLQRMGGENQFAIGAPSAGRSHHDLEDCIGLFTKMLALELDLEDQPDFRTLLTRVRKTCLDGYAHQNIPLQELYDGPLPFQVCFNLLNQPLTLPPLKGLDWDLKERIITDAKCPITIYAREEAQGFNFSVHYRSDLFSSWLMEQLLDHWTHLLQQVLEEPNKPIQDYELPPAKTALRWEKRQTHSALCQIESAVSQYTNSLAINSGHTQWTYGELWQQSCELAVGLQEYGIRQGDLVAVIARREADLVPLLLGIWRAQAAFFIVEPEPVETMSKLLTASAPSLIVDMYNGQHPFATDAPTLQIQNLPRPGKPATWQPDLFQMAHVLATSGSTGIPKCVASSFGPLSHYLSMAPITHAMSSADVFAMTSGLSHDPLLRDIFTPLVLGATLWIPSITAGNDPEILAKELEKQQVTVLHLVPTHAALLAQVSAQKPNRHLKCLLLGGEATSPQTIAAIENYAPNATCWNVYGATETPQVVLCNRVALPLDNPWSHGGARVLDAKGRPAPPGAMGEIFVIGETLAYGYLNDPVATAASFVPDPHSLIEGARRYRTGDMARYDANGRIHILGRKDRQCNIAGLRIELSAIEACLIAHAKVDDAAVLVQEGDTLFAWVAGQDFSETPQELSESLQWSLREHLERHLPARLCPARFGGMQRLPQLTNGKRDWRMLSTHTKAQQTRTTTYQTANTELTQQLVKIWEDALGISPIGINDDFFQLGGHSLQAIQIIMTTRETLSIPVEARDIFVRRTIANLAHEIEMSREVRQRNQEMAFEEDDDEEMVF